MPKQTLRQLMLDRRKTVDAAEQRGASRIIQQTLTSSVEFSAAGTLALYAAIQNEVETEDLLHAALSQGKIVVFPVVSGARLLFRSVTHLAQLQRGAFGIPEPATDCPLRSPDEVDLFVVPAVAFALNGQRIGYGKGFYDRTLHFLEGSGKLAGVCYDFQLVDRIDDEPHDVRMDLIITEKRVVYPRDLL